MKTIASILLAGGILTAIAAPTANEDFVIAEDAKTYTNAVNAAKEYTDAATSRPVTRIVTEDGTRFTDATGSVFAVSSGSDRFVVTNLIRAAPGVEFVYTNINPIAWGLVDGGAIFQQTAKFIAYDATTGRWLALAAGFANYLTPETLAGLDANLQSAANTPADVASFVIYDRGYVGDAGHAEGTFYRVAGAPVTSLVDRVVFESSVPQTGVSTNDVKNIVTNTVSGWSEWTWSGSYTPGDGYRFDLTFGDIVSSRWTLYRVEDDTGRRTVVGYSNFDIDQPSSIDDVDVSNFGYSGTAFDVTATRQRITRNALGLARLVDLPPLTNGLATAQFVGGEIAHFAETGTVANAGYADNANNAATSSQATTAEGLLDREDYRTAENIFNQLDSAASTNDLFVAATDGTNYTDAAIANADTTYTRFAISAPTNVNQSVQYVNITAQTPSTLAVLLPQGTGTKDWIIYVNSRTNVAISLPAATWWLADTSATNDIAPATPTALYFSEIGSGKYLMSRQELTEIVTQ